MTGLKKLAVNEALAETRRARDRWIGALATRQDAEKRLAEASKEEREAADRLESAKEALSLAIGPAGKKIDPREDPEFRALLADAGEFETLRVWVVTKARNAGSSRPARNKADWAGTAWTVASVVSDMTRGWPAKQVARAFREAYPFGTREHWPYKAWLSAVARVQGRKLSTRRRKAAPEKTGSLFS